MEDACLVRPSSRSGGNCNVGWRLAGSIGDCAPPRGDSICCSLLQLHIVHTTRGLTYDALRILVSQALYVAQKLLTFPTPLMTPPDTSTYFMVALCGRSAVWGRGRKERSELRRGQESFVSPVAWWGKRHLARLEDAREACPFVTLFQHHFMTFPCPGCVVLLSGLPQKTS
jgi:hypothetical protein